MSDVLLVSANRGIGLELARAFSARGDTVNATFRSTAGELDALSVSAHGGVDVCERSSLEALAAQLGPAALDTLVVCAGILESNALSPFDEASIRRQFETNALGPLRAVEVLAPSVRDGGKVALLTSRMGSIADNTSGGSYGYRMSKAALNAAGKSLAHDLAPREISVGILHPGWVRTEMTHGSGLMDADECAARLIARIDELEMSRSGAFFHANGEALPW